MDYFIPFFLAVFPWIMLFFLMPLREKRLRKYIRKQALEGNRVAIELMKNDFKISTKNSDVIHAAIQGNQNAIEILGLKIEKAISNSIFS